MWRKSSKSDSGASCVEVRNDLTAIRDSKNPNGPTLTVDLSPLLTSLRFSKLNQ